MNFTVPIERKGLDRLLEAHPHLVLLKYERQRDHVGPWIEIELGQRSEGPADVYAVYRYAIWKETGAVYGYEPDNPAAVQDDPLWEP